MSISAIRSALETALMTLSPSLSTSTAWQNVPFKPAAGQPYQRVDLMLAMPDDRELGGPNFLERGIFQVTLLYPIGTGSGDATVRAEMIRSLFKQRATFTASGINVIITNVPEVPPALIDGDRYAQPVRVRFQASCPM